MVARVWGMIHLAFVLVVLSAGKIHINGAAVGKQNVKVNRQRHVKQTHYFNSSRIERFTNRLKCLTPEEDSEFPVSIVSNKGVFSYIRNPRQSQRDYGEIPDMELEKHLHEKYFEESPNKRAVEENSDAGEDRPRDRTTRFVPKSRYSLWDKGIVPYDLKKGLTQSGIEDIYTSMNLLEKYTCIRFVPWVKNETKHKFGLPDESHLNFIKGQGCVSYILNNHYEKGQMISCCHWVFCPHEMGHGIGFFHGQNSPDRHGWIRINWENMPRGEWESWAIKDPESFVVHRYDFTSKMHYGSFGEKRKQTILFRDLEEPNMFSLGENMYYYLMDITVAYKCKEKHCSSFHTDCVNDGFVSLVDGKCACMCPPGLDPETGCSTNIKRVTAPLLWPSGSYATLSPVNGCPDLKEFEEGSRSHYSDGNSSTSLANGRFNLKGHFSKDRFSYSFCVKTGDVHSGSDRATWERGRYCILRKGNTCPEYFKDVGIKFDDKAQSETETNSVSGVLPDGEFGDDTLLKFCCRFDGYPAVPLHLPNKRPFVLFSTTESKCQTVDDCGGVVNLTRESPSTSFTSPNYPDLYENNLECVWLVLGPSDSSIILDFQDFDIDRKDNKSCWDYLKIRYVLPGQDSFKYCGEGFNRSVRSLENIMTLTLTTDLTGQRRGFKARVKLVLPENHCFDQEDKGLNYRGKVTFTRDLRTCLHWDNVTSCPHHMFMPQHFESGLEKNYCRNPDNTFRPWCYTGIKDGLCDRDYCDVCLLERLYDKRPDCDERKTAGFCSQDVSKVIEECAHTCDPPLPLVKAVGCWRPDDLDDADPVTIPKDSYKVGETITFKCRTGHEKLTRRCLTNGQWSPAGYVCGGCPSGWSPFAGACYKYHATKRTYAQAVSYCSQENAIVATAKNEEEADFIATLGIKTYSMFIGLTDIQDEGTFIWSDNTTLTRANWKTGEPNGNDRKKDEDCVCAFGEDKYSTWYDVPCDSKYRFVCKFSPSERILCKDRRNDCEEIMPHFYKCTENPDFAWHECPKTCRICT